MRTPKHPGELMQSMHRKAKHKKMHVTSPITGLKEGSPKDVAMDKKIAAHLKSKEEKGEGMKYKKAHKVMCKKDHKHTAACGVKHKAAKLGSGKRFAALSSKVEKAYEKKGKSKEAAKRIGAAVAAKVGAAKYGQKKMTKMAVAGKKRVAKK